MNQNLEQLKKLAQIFNTDKLISPEEIQQIFKGIVEILATYKKDTSSINEDTKSVVNKLLEDVISIHKESVDAVEEKKKELGNDFADKLTELRQMVTSIQEEMDKEDEVPEDDTDDEEEKQALIAEIMAQITLPEVKATIVSGEEIVDKINELPLDEDNKIDWARIKNAPKIGKQTISGSPTVLANAVDLDGSTRANGYAITWDATRGRYTHSAAGSGTPGGSTTQLQYNNAGAFGGISGATTDGTAVTYTANNLKAADITASGSGGFLIQSNSGTDVVLFGAGGGAGATFYGGVNLNTMTTGSVLFAGASGAISQDNSNLFWDDSKNALGILTTTPGLNDTSSGIGGSTHLDIVGGDLRVGGGRLNLSNIGNAAEYLYSPSSSGQVYLGSRNNVVFLANNDGNGVGDFSWKTGSNVQDSTTNAKMYLTNAGLLGIGTTAPTHTLTLASTSTGIALYNTADQTTNYERVVQSWSGNQFIIEQRNGGTGVGRSLLLRTTDNADGNAAFINIFSASNVKIDMGVAGSFGGETNLVRIGSGTSLTASTSITQRFLEVTGTVNQSATAAYTALLVNPTETTTGSGTKRLLDLQVNSTSLLSVDNLGDIDWQTGAHYIRHGGAQYIGFNAGTGKMELVNGLSTGNGTVVYIAPTATSTSASQKIINISPTINQTSGTGGYTALHLNVTETATGSGTKLLADFQVGGVSKTFINNTGLIGTTFAGTQLNFQTSSYIISSTNGSTFFQTGFSGKTFELKDSGAVTRVSFAHDTGIMTNPQIVNTPATITVTTNAGTVTRANRINNFTNSSAAAMTITMSTTGALDGDMVVVRIKDFSAAAQTITWVNTENSTVTAPTTSNGSTTLPLTVGFMYNSATSKWRCIASA
jgi:hypothetical protein